MNNIDNNVEKIRKTIEKGSGNWNGYDHVYGKIQEACYYLRNNAYLSQEHEYMMAVLGCGHEERMKYEMALCYSKGYIK